MLANGPTRSRELSLATKVSIANFQGILRRLRDDGIIVSFCDEKDRRVRLFDLAEHVRQECEVLLSGGVGCAGGALHNGHDRSAGMAGNPG